MYQEAACRAQNGKYPLGIGDGRARHQTGQFDIPLSWWNRRRSQCAACLRGVVKYRRLMMRRLAKKGGDCPPRLKGGASASGKGRLAYRREMQMQEILENADEKLTARMRRLLDFVWQEWKRLQLQIKKISRSFCARN